jgi:hypothetical protein
MNIKMYRTTISSADFLMGNLPSLMLKNEHRLRVLENMPSRKILGTKREAGKKLHNQKLHVMDHYPM